MTARRKSQPRPPANSSNSDVGASVMTRLPFGSHGRTHPAWGVGLWGLGRWTAEDEQRTRATIERALELGVPWFDTAEVYGAGRSERLLGDILAHAKSSEPPVFLTTKVSWEHLRPAQVKAAITGSLQRLGRRSVDVYLVHSPDPHVGITETMAAMAQAQVEGRTVDIGVSNFDVDELEAARAALPGGEIVVDQVRYNLLDRDEGDALREYCRAHQIVIEAYTPIARGLLAGRYLDGGPVAPEVRRFSHDLFGEDRFPLLKRQAEAIREIARAEDVPMLSLALHWLASRGAAPVVGASRPDQVDALVEAWGHVPSASAIERADAVTRHSK